VRIVSSTGRPSKSRDFFLAIEKTLPKEQSDPSDAQLVRELLLLLVKAQKARRLYQDKNAISDRLQAELFSKISSHLDEAGSITLAIREFTILFDEDTVYESDNRNDSLAFLLFRDGIRRLSFHPGLDERELQDFLRCLNRVALLSNEQDDLVTLFWEADFKSIRYYAIEELSNESEGPSLQEQLATGTLEGREGAAAAPADAASLKDIEQPVAHLPVEACRLNEADINALHSELAKEEEEPFAPAVVELAIELALLETSAEEVSNIADHLVAIVKRLLEEGELEAVTHAVEHLSGLKAMAFHDSESIGNMWAKLVRCLGDKEQLARFLGQAEARRSLKPPRITTYLAQLGKEALTTAVPWMGRMTTAAHRRAVAEAISTLGLDVNAALDRYLPPNNKRLDVSFVREALYVITCLPPAQAFPIIERLLSSADAETRRETTQVLGRFKDRRSAEVCLELLNDEDTEVRATALDSLVRLGASELARSILERTVLAEVFDERSLSEKRRIYAAAAKLAGENALKWFVNILQPDERRWFASRKEREGCEAVAHGIRMVGTEKAQRLLEKLADQGDRFIRAACLKELGTDRKA
jgi:hypothetical protein